MLCYKWAWVQFHSSTAPHASTQADRAAAILNIVGYHGRRTLRTIALPIKRSSWQEHIALLPIPWPYSATREPMNTTLPCATRNFLLKILGGHYLWQPLWRWMCLCMCVHKLSLPLGLSLAISMAVVQKLLNQLPCFKELRSSNIKTWTRVELSYLSV